MEEQILATTIPHSDVGPPGCCGCLVAIIHSRQAQLVCNECSAIVGTIAVDDLQCVIDELELSLGFATAECPHCGAVNLAPGFSELTGFVCDRCGEGVNLPAHESRQRHS